MGKGSRARNCFSESFREGMDHIDWRETNIMKKSIVKVDNICAEDLFQWFYNHIMSSCGDGVATIVCKNYMDVADFFIVWFKVNYIDKGNCDYLIKNNMNFYHPRDEYGNVVNFHNANENFIFTNTRHKNDGQFHDYVFEVLGDCKFEWTKELREKKILKYKE